MRPLPKVGIQKWEITVRSIFSLAPMFTFMTALAIPVTAFSGDVGGIIQSNHSPAAVFIPKLSELKSRTHVPILLPDGLPKPFSDAKYVVIESANESQYDIGLYYRLDYGNAGFAGSFSGNAKPNYNPRDLPHVDSILLANGIQGYFRPVSCGGSCAPANLWWKIGDVLYQLQLKLRSDMDTQQQKDIVSSVADSAICAGAR